MQKLKRTLIILTRHLNTNMDMIKCVEYVGEIYDLSCDLSCVNTLFIWKTARGLYRYSRAIKRTDDDTQFDQTIYTFDCGTREKLKDVTDNLGRDAAKNCEHMMKYDGTTFIKTADIKWYLNSICSQYVESADDISTDGSHDESSADDSWTQDVDDDTAMIMLEDSEKSEKSEESEESSEISEEMSEESFTDISVNPDVSVNSVNSVNSGNVRPRLARTSKRPCTWIDDRPIPLKRARICPNCTEWEHQHAENQHTIQQLRDKIARLESRCIDFTD
jgi:hypothetical protein